MIELQRTVRFSIDLGESGRNVDQQSRSNSFAGWPSVAGIGAYFELKVSCRGTPDKLTGYLLNISQIDQAVRDECIPIIARAVRRHPATHPGAVLVELMPAVQGALNNAVTSIEWQLTPYYSVTMETDALDRVLISQSFEFSASHRLHVAELSEARNREVFGKCNNPNSHGHNYRFKPVVSVPLNQPAGGTGGARLTLPQIEQIVDRTIIQRFDHKHLNLDTAEFAQLNPSVEHITKVCYDRLAGPIAQAGGRLVRVTVWENEKTSCTYPAG